LEALRLISYQITLYFFFIPCVVFQKSYAPSAATHCVIFQKSYAPFVATHCQCNAGEAELGVLGFQSLDEEARISNKKKKKKEKLIIDGVDQNEIVGP